MNTKMIMGVGAVVVVLGVGYYLLNSANTAQAPSDTLATTSPTLPNPPADDDQSKLGQSSATEFSKPKIEYGVPQVVYESWVKLDQSTFVSTSSNPMITGTANIPKVALIVNNAQGKGIEATENIVVKNGHWAYYSTVSLSPGTYAVEVYGGATVQKATLIVQN